MLLFTVYYTVFNVGSLI